MLYTDPGSGILLWQMLGAAAVGGMFYVRKIFSLFGAKRPAELKQEDPKFDLK
jgi:hypothetical protein